MFSRIIWYKFADVSDVIAASIIITLMIEAARTSETSVNFCETTRRNIPEDRRLRIRRPENLKSHEVAFGCANAQHCPHSCPSK
jgi:hypothetical protein